MLTDTQIFNLVEIVRTVSRTEIMPRFRNLDPGDISAKTSPMDLVTIADQRAEDELKRRIKRLLPQAMIVGEEGVAADPDLLGAIGSTEMTVILDPIDGTWNYTHGISTFGVILAVMAGRETVFGLIYDPVFEDWIMASRGAGAMKGAAGHTSQSPIKASGKRDTRAFNGFLPLRAFPEHTQPRLDAAQRRLGMVKSLHCSAHEYRLLSAGLVDFQLSAGTKPWDHAAGQLIHSEAGGVSRFLDGRDYSAMQSNGHMLSAPCEDSWEELADLFRRALH
jgi:fructose-1,6-bisphosphatase/inositol monophosphatase family enzyme